MKMFVVVLLLVLFVAAPVKGLCDVPFCDVAMETMKLSDWIACAVFAILMGDADESSPGIVVHL
ncbi:MAG: hypothetical protein NTX17_05285 [Candidatus Eisenbacteria bacterium]|nr:hypothetical protein [Candidatus Eisenbacteria bacterium]